MTKIKLYIANPQSNDSGAAKGSVSNPYTETEYESMINNGTWPGGYVQNMGYVMKEVVISSSYPDSGVVDSDISWSSDDSWTWSEPWDSSSEPCDGTDGYGNSGNNHNKGSQSRGGNSGSYGGENTSIENSDGHDIHVNTLVIGTHSEISEYSRNLLYNLKGNYGKIVITSTFSSPEEQAKAMLNNIKKTGIDTQLKLYAAPGDAVIRTYNPTYSDAENVTAMTTEIYNQGPRKVSKHCMSAEEYKTLNVMDISRRQIKNPKEFVTELINTIPNIIIFDEINNGCIHIEIPQP